MADDAFIRKEEFLLVQRLFDERFRAHEELDRERHENIDMRLNEVMDTVNELPNKNDLNYQTQTINTRIETLQSGIAEKQKEAERQREASDRRILRWLAIIGTAIAILTLVLKFVKID